MRDNGRALWRPRRSPSPNGRHDYSAFGTNGADVRGLPDPVQYPAGVTLLEQGSEAREVFYVAHGLVKLQTLHEDGLELMVGLRSSGWFLGATAAILDRPYAATATTVTPCCLSWMEAGRFRERVSSDRELSWRLLRMHGEEVYAQAEDAARHKTLPARKRLEQFLARWISRTAAANANGFVPVEVPLRQWEIAQLIGVTPQYLCQLFSELERDGVASREGDRLTIFHRLVTPAEP